MTSSTFSYDRQDSGFARITVNLRVGGILLLLLSASCDLSDDATRVESGDSPHRPAQPASPPEGEWLIPEDEIVDGGPGKDGIPSIERPDFAPAGEIELVPDERMVVGVNIQGNVRAYPHQILDWHEIVNDRIGFKSVAVTFCPLTGTALCWNREIEEQVVEFGVSGLLFRNNLIAYDRATNSHWPQMQLRSAIGEHSGFNLETYQVVETSWQTWKKLYPDSQVLTDNTGHERDYEGYAYGADYPSNESIILFPTHNTDTRLGEKDRVHVVIDSESADMDAEAKAYVIAELGEGVQVIEDRVGHNDYLVAGSGYHDFVVAFEIGLAQESLQFEGVQNRLPVIMKDTEGNLWDIFGFAVEGPRTGERLTAARSYIGYWFAVSDFFPGLDIYGKNGD